jgi:hypothetical protein
MLVVRAQHTQQFVDGRPFQRVKLGRDAQPDGNVTDLAMLGAQPLDLESMSLNCDAEQRSLFGVQVVQQILFEGEPTSAQLRSWLLRFDGVCQILKQRLVVFVVL